MMLEKVKRTYFDGYLLDIIYNKQCEILKKNQWNVFTMVRQRSSLLNIATGETSQAITPYHFFNYSNFFGFYH